MFNEKKFFSVADNILEKIKIDIEENSTDIALKVLNGKIKNKEENEKFEKLEEMTATRLINYIKNNL